MPCLDESDPLARLGARSTPSRVDVEPISVGAITARLAQRSIPRFVLPGARLTGAGSALITSANIDTVSSSSREQPIVAAISPVVLSRKEQLKKDLEEEERREQAAKENVTGDSVFDELMEAVDGGLIREPLLAVIATLRTVHQNQQDMMKWITEKEAVLKETAGAMHNIREELRSDFNEHDHTWPKKGLRYCVQTCGRLLGVMIHNFNNKRLENPPYKKKGTY